MRNFNKGKNDEFRCRCGCGLGVNDMDQETLEALDDSRDDAGVSFIIDSAIRCPNHNAKVGGKKDSSHLYGYGVDIRAGGSYKRFLIVKALLANGFIRIGIHRGFIHADMDPNKPKQVLFLY